MRPLEIDRRRAELAQAVGSVAMSRAEFDTARRRFEEARDLFGLLQDPRGQADSIRLLGDLAVAEGRAVSALSLYEEAQQRYEAIGDSTLAEACGGYAVIARARVPQDEDRGPEQLFLANLPVIEAIIAQSVRRYRFSREEQDDFASIARLKLIDNDYQVLRMFSGRASIRTYLKVVISQIFRDHLVELWGKWRPSAEAQKLGQVAIELERLITRDELSENEAIALISVKQSLADDGLDEIQLRAIVAKLPRRLSRRMVGENVLLNMPAADRADASVERDDVAERSRRINVALEELLPTLSAEDRLLLSMRVTHNMQVSHIARTLNVDQKPLYRRIDQILRHLRRELEERGFSPSDATTLLAEGAWRHR
jgi:RNA polymerase sigma factor for flagellar operon FliA